MAVKTVEIKNNTTKTVNLKKDSVIKFSDMTTGVTDSDIKFDKKGRNLIISSESNGFKVTVKKYFISAKKDISKINLKLSTQSTTNYNIGGFGTKRINWTLRPYSSKKSYYGTMWADSCTSDTNKYKKIYFYSGSDNLLTSFKHDQKIYFGSGTKTVYVNPTETDATKIDTTFYATENTTLKLRNLQDSDLKYVSRSKNDLVLSNNKNHKIIFKNYLTKDNKYNIQAGDYTNSTNTSEYKNLKTYINSLSEEYRTQKLKKSGVLKGTYFNDTLKGTGGNDKIYCVGGTNKVYAYSGNDKIYCGTGVDKIMFKDGDGVSTIYNSDSSDLLAYEIDTFDKLYKEGNNLVITCSDDFLFSGKIVIADYFKNVDNRLYKLGDVDIMTFDIDDALTVDNSVSTNPEDFYLYNHKITVNGTKKSETHNLANGKFDIYLNSGKDTIIVDKNAKTTINVTSDQNVTGMEKNGNDAVFYYETFKGTKKGKNIYKNGKITIKDFFTTDLTKNGRGSSSFNMTNIKLKADTNLLSYEYLMNTKPVVHLTSSDLKEGDLYRIDGIEKIDLMIGEVDFKYWVTGSKKNERITLKNTQKNIVDSGAGNDIVHAEINKDNKNSTVFCYSAGNDNYIGGFGNDTYYVGAKVKSLNDDFTANIKKTSFDKKTALLINDKGGSDTMNISAKTKDIRILFNVDKTGKIITNATEAFLRSDNKYTDSLLIFNKSSLTGKNLQSMIKDNGFKGAIEIDNWFANGKSTANANYNDLGEGYIEKINTNNSQNLNMTSWINQVKNDVVSWLTTGTYANKYNSVADVFNSSDKNAINSLVAVFAKSEYK